VRVLCDAKNGHFTLSVTNGGEKIPDQAMAGLFRPFVRGKAAADREGLGLGLYIASEIAAAHEGELTVVSTSEETCFCFSMPLR
jgi:signal transduction histidine kinase